MGRRSMEGSNKGGGEVRRANLVYFLSRDGKIEHPHLIRVHHLHRNGVHLRDVKRWLSDLRGKDMPNSFAWSYKRRYKTGYVWQDLMDDDLITPISDNEYVLKGSLVPSSTPTKSDFFPSLDHEKTPKAGESEEHEMPAPKPQPETLQIELDDSVSPKPPPQLDQESPSGHPDEAGESTQRSVVLKIDLAERQRHEKERGSSHAGEGRGSSQSSSYSRRASHVFRNILTCGLVETNDSALRRLGDEKEPLTAGSGPHRRSELGLPTRPRQQKPDRNNSRKSRTTSGGKSSRKAGEKAVAAVYRPVAAPNCSQCGKGFNPEKLYSHMQSCKALKGRGKGSINLERVPLRTESHRE